MIDHRPHAVKGAGCLAQQPTLRATLSPASSVQGDDRAWTGYICYCTGYPQGGVNVATGGAE